jgi:hypothetical protein
MGWKYVLFRLRFEWMRKTGMLRKRFPESPAPLQYPEWRSFSSSLLWVWGAKEDLKFPRNPKQELEEKALNILQGKITLFNSFDHIFSGPESWIIHPETGYRYDIRQHWTQIPDISPVAGDIKYVWEKSRFTYLHTIMRYDFHFGLDHSEWVMQEIESWMGMNPINCGPNFRCSQEISLRCFNWIGALSFYRNSPAVTEERWQKIAHFLYWQLHHVWENIQFSRIAVRNNHAITECLALYISGLIFPDLPDTRKWKEKGKSWFEEEIQYQIYPDGSYIQHSMNYHRVMVQLLTLGIRMAEISGEKFSTPVYKRAAKALDFLRFCQDPVSGKVPNYGANDGALFFQFTHQDFRQYSSQINALEAALYGHLAGREEIEEAGWFGFAAHPHLPEENDGTGALHIFSAGGYASVKEKECLTFFRCGRHKDRPSQADNLHLDLWFRGENLFVDGGTFKYNTQESDIQYFFGSRSHNVVMLDGENQMLKGPRFVWLYWSQALGLSAVEEDSGWVVSGKALVFAQTGHCIVHHRTIRKVRDKPIWQIEDRIEGKFESRLELIWHPSAFALAHFNLEVKDGSGRLLNPNEEAGFVSEYYGRKEPLPFRVYESDNPVFTTHISPKDPFNQF